MYNRMSMLTIFLLILLLVILLTSMCVSCMSFKPYRADTVFSKEYVFEGFTATKPDTSYTNAADGNNIDSTYSSYLLKDTDKKCKKVHGFNGVYCDPADDVNKLDAFGEVKGDLGCVGQSSGLSNSTGALCLDENQKQLLSTRGGNQSA